MYKIFGSKYLDIFDPTLRNLKDNDEERKAWIRDQYIHPIESLHTIDNVLEWFNKNDIEFINSIPSSNFEDDDKGENDDMVPVLFTFDQEDKKVG